MTIPPWSHSMLEVFELCPHKWYNQYILKVKAPPFDSGIEAHKALENSLKNNALLPVIYERFEPMLQAVQNARAGKKLYTELQVGMTAALTPCGFFAPNVWGRSAIDVLLHNGRAAWIGDWKTGKVREKATQHKIMALFAFLHFPTLEEITGCNLWLEHGKIGERYEFTRDMMPEMWAEQLARLERMYAAFEQMKLPAVKSPLCNGWCHIEACSNWKPKALKAG